MKKIISLLMAVLLVLLACLGLVLTSGDGGNLIGGLKNLLTKDNAYNSSSSASSQPTPNQKNVLSKQTIVCFGDSIFANGVIASTIAKSTKAKVHNIAFGGCRMSTHDENYDPFCMYRLAEAVASGDFTSQENSAAGTVVSRYFKKNVKLLKSIDFNRVDSIVIAYGTNDFTVCKGLAAPDDNLKSIKTFDGALRYSIETIKEKYPHITIFLCTPIYRFYLTSDGEFLKDSDTKINKLGHKLIDYGNTIKSVGAEYDLPVIDNYNIGINKSTKDKYFNADDGVHPKANGCKIIGNNIAKEIKNYYSKIS